MKVWIHINGVQEGPYELDQLPLDRMTPETPVWYEGLSYWEPAGKAVLTQRLFNRDAYPASSVIDDEQPIEIEEIKVESQRHQPYGSAYDRTYAYAQATTGQPAEKCPATYIVWSILFTVLCCNPIGIIPIALGTIVKSKYQNFDYEGAKRKSETTAWWLMITIVTSLIMLPFSMLMSF